jgi:hypothetical protein
MSDDGLYMVPPDDTWRFIWGKMLTDATGLILMVKWRAWGIGFEFWSRGGFGLFLGPLCLAIGRVEEGTPPHA